MTVGLVEGKGMVCSPAWHLRAGGVEVALQVPARLHPLGVGLKARRRGESRILPSPLKTGQWREGGAAGFTGVWGRKDSGWISTGWYGGPHTNGVHRLWGWESAPPTLKTSPEREKTLHYIIRLLSFISSIVHVHPFLSGTRIMVSLGPLVTRMIPSFCVLPCCGNK